jgi:ppGpp synthetase/RelA/SpoT-type nucleotidyltranferase
MTISRSQIDKLGDRLLEDPIRPADYELLEAYREGFRAAYEAVVATIAARTSLAVSGRAAKSTTAIVAKLRRGTTKLSQMQDIAGCRVSVGSIKAQDELAAMLVAGFQRTKPVDRRSTPSHGYRAVHVIAWAYGKPVEIQIRTELQHLWAQLSERLADRFGSELKYGGGPGQAASLLMRASARVTRIEDAESSGASSEVIATQRDKLQDILHQMIVYVDERLFHPTGTS